MWGFEKNFEEEEELYEEKRIYGEKRKECKWKIEKKDRWKKK